MAGISRYEKAALGLTAAFLLFTGGWFYARQSAAQPYTVTVSQSAPEVSSAPAASNNEESKPESLLEGEVIDINSAPVEDLQRLPGIGEKRAQAIVDYRESSGPFQSVEELTEVKGIGEGILAQVYDSVTVGGPDSPAE